MSKMPLRAGVALVALTAGVAWAQVSVERPWIRGTVVGQSATGAFMDLHSDTDLTLVRATSPVAKSVAVHSMELQDGVMKMRAVDRLPLPAGKTVRLAPGGYHIMLADLKEPLKNGESVPITLTFEDAHKKIQTLTVKAEVRGLGIAPPPPKTVAKPGN